MLTETLTAILAVPPAIDACKNLINSLRGRLAHEPDKQDAQRLETTISEIARNIVRFSDFTEEVRKWKEIHHITQLILYNDLPATLAIHRRGLAEFEPEIHKRSEGIRAEFTLLTRGPSGAFRQIDALNPSDFEVTLPPGFALVGKNWGAHFKTLGTRAERAFTRRNYSTLYDHLTDLETDCTQLNVKADTMLKQALEDITRVMHDFRSRMEPTSTASNA